MSFRLRIFLLVMLTAVTAIGATAFLTLKLTTREVANTRQASLQHQDEIVDTLSRYGLEHGQWPGVDRVAADLAERTRLHLRLRTPDGEVVVDTDTLKGRTPGLFQPYPVPVDPRPTLDNAIGQAAADEYSVPTGTAEFLGKRRLIEVTKPVFPANLFGRPPSGTFDASPIALAVRQLAQYRAALLAVQCIARFDPGFAPALPLATAPYLTAAVMSRQPTCAPGATTTVLNDNAWLLKVWKAFVFCALSSSEGPRACMNQTFLSLVRTADQLQVYFGAPSADIGQFGRPALYGVLGLVLVAVAGTAWIARRVSRPVRRLTEASRLLANGHHDVRVPAKGRDELARLSASFNTMAAAVQSSEERQRRLVADVAHELRTPLSNLRGYLEGLADGVVEPNRDLFVSLHEETLLQRRILDDLQVLVEAETGDLTYDKRLIDLAELAAGGVTAQRAVAYEAHVALHVEVHGQVWVTADADRLRQVLGNLVTNAIRYTDSDGHVLVRVRAEGTSAVLSVQDTGVGIAPDDLERVFDRFWRADPARQRATGGSGLGLTIAHRIVSDHGGRIDVASQPGAGTTFTVTLPLSPVPDLSPAQPLRARTAAQPDR